MRVLSVIDSMKGSLTSIEANAIISAVFFDEIFSVTELAIADGGEGTVAAFLKNCAAEEKLAKVSDLAGREMLAHYAWLEKEKLAVIESADAAGIHLLTDNNISHPRQTSTIGVGQTIQAALTNQAKKIIIGLGGTGTIDGGIGAMSALGVVFFDVEGKLLEPIGNSLGSICTISYDNVDPRIRDVEFILASDVDSFLTGEAGAVQMFGKQKGLKDSEMNQYEADMLSYHKTLTSSCENVAGDGAAGGLGIGLRVLLQAEMVSGIDLLAQYFQLVDQIAQADLIFTGEGKLDPQSLKGKVPVGISRLAQKKDVQVIAFVGSFEGESRQYEEVGFHAVVPMVTKVCTLDQALSDAAKNLTQAANTVKNILLLNEGRNV